MGNKSWGCEISEQIDQPNLYRQFQLVELIQVRKKKQEKLFSFLLYT